MRAVFVGFVVFIVLEVLVMQQIASLMGWLWVLVALLAAVILGRKCLAGVSIKGLQQSGFSPLPAGRLITHVVAGVLLVVPGFITDIIALLLLLPFTAPWLQAQLLRRMGGRFNSFNPAPDGHVFEGEFQRETPSRKPLPPSP